MITKLAAKMSFFFADKNIYNHDEIQVYKYGFELLISTILNGIFLFVISIFMGVVFEALLFAVAFISLRITAGGYHAKHHWSCILTINVVFYLFASIIKVLNINIVLPYALFGVMISSLIVWSLSPVEAVNKPLSDYKKEILRKRSIVITTINMAAVLVFYFIPQLPRTFIAFYISGALSASLSLVVAVVTSKLTEPHSNR